MTTRNDRTPTEREGTCRSRNAASLTQAERAQLVGLVGRRGFQNRGTCKAREIPTLETERLRLRPFLASDFEDVAAMFGDPEVMRYLGRGTPYSRELAWGNLAYMAGHWLFLGYGMWAVEEKATRQFAGRIGFCQPYGWPGFELAWALVRSRWGRGYATEGARTALRWAFETLKQDRVISLIHPENHASIRVAERLGERVQGRTPVLGVEHLVYGAELKSEECAGLQLSGTW